MEDLIQQGPDPLVLIEKYYGPWPHARALLFRHSRLVADLALEVAGRVPHLGPDARFIEEAALLHDIGIYLTDAPGLGCMGQHPYICHGHLGRKLLEAEGMPRHALVAERHVGVGLSAEDIVSNGFPIPAYEMQPFSIEERVVAYADKFYTKGTPDRRLTMAEARAMIARYGEGKLAVFDGWARLFGEAE